MQNLMIFGSLKLFGFVVLQCKYLSATNTKTKCDYQPLLTLKDPHSDWLLKPFQEGSGCIFNPSQTLSQQQDVRSWGMSWLGRSL